MATPLRRAWVICDLGRHDRAKDGSSPDLCQIDVLGILAPIKGRDALMVQIIASTSRTQKLIVVIAAKFYGTAPYGFHFDLLSLTV